MRTVSLLCILALLGCHHSLKTVSGPEGELLYEANCDGGRRTMGDCMNIAGEACKGSGYDILDRDKEFGSKGGIYANKGFLYGAQESDTKRTLLFRCRGGDPAAVAKKEPAPAIDAAAMRARAAPGE